MKRSAQVGAPLLASVALSMLAGCRQEQMKRCVDEHNVVVDNSLCDANQQQQRPNGGGFYYPYRYYYGGTGGFTRGSVVSGGAFTPSAGAHYSTSRGGFGSTHASGGGSHGGSGE